MIHVILCFFFLLESAYCVRLGERINITDPEASCLDGSKPVFYLRRGFGSGANKFHIYFEGGGWCSGLTFSMSHNTESCQHRSKTALGSSKSYPLHKNFDFDYLSSNNTVNPLTYNWSTVYAPYCDGTSWTGNRKHPILLEDGTWLFFRGFLNLNAMFQMLVKHYSFGTASDVLVSGCSAGGLTTWLHSDYIRQSFVPAKAKFMAMPDSGFFMEYEGAGGYITAMKWLFDVAEAQNALPSKCVDKWKAPDAYRCMFAQNVAPFVSVPMFPLQSRFDSWQIGMELKSCNVEAINKYGDALMDTFISQFVNTRTPTKKHGGFFDSCFHHCGEWNRINIDGRVSSEAMVEFYNAGKGEADFWLQVQSYPCKDCCPNKEKISTG